MPIMRRPEKDKRRYRYRPVIAFGQYLVLMMSSRPARWLHTWLTPRQLDTEHRMGTKTTATTSRRASAYLRGDMVYLSSLSKTTVGVWITSSSVLAVDAGNAIALGEAILACFAASQTGVAHPAQADWPKIGAPLLRLAKVRSWKAFNTGTRLVGLNMTDDTTTFMPAQNLGRKGFIYITSADFSRTGDATILGPALLEAFQLSL